MLRRKTHALTRSPRETRRVVARSASLFTRSEKAARVRHRQPSAADCFVILVGNLCAGIHSPGWSAYPSRCRRRRRSETREQQRRGASSALGTHRGRFNATRRNVSILANNRVVFNIKGNDYRLVVAMRYDTRSCLSDSSVRTPNMTGST